LSRDWVLALSFTGQKAACDTVILRKYPCHLALAAARYFAAILLR